MYACCANFQLLVKKWCLKLQCAALSQKTDTWLFLHSLLHLRRKHTFMKRKFMMQILTVKITVRNMTTSYRISVLTLATSMSYNFLTAILIIGLLARLSTMKTRVLLSSIFFMADSVVRGYLIRQYWSSLRKTLSYIC